MSIIVWGFCKYAFLFWNISILRCYPIKNATELCEGVYGECTQNSKCTQGACQCDQHFYNRLGHCRRINNVSQTCEGVDGECIRHAACHAGQCQCVEGYFATEGRCDAVSSCFISIYRETF